MTKNGFFSLVLCSSSKMNRNNFKRALPRTHVDAAFIQTNQYVLVINIIYTISDVMSQEHLPAWNADGLVLNADDSDAKHPGMPWEQIPPRVAVSTRRYSSTATLRYSLDNCSGLRISRPKDKDSSPQLQSLETPRAGRDDSNASNRVETIYSGWVPAFIETEINRKSQITASPR